MRRKMNEKIHSDEGERDFPGTQKAENSKCWQSIQRGGVERRPGFKLFGQKTEEGPVLQRASVRERFHRQWKEKKGNAGKKKRSPGGGKGVRNSTNYVKKKKKTKRHQHR